MMNTIESRWKKFLATIPSDASQGQLQIMRHAFFAGATAAYVMLNESEHSVARAVLIGRELLLFSETMTNEERI